MDECITKYIELAEAVFNIDQVLAGVIPAGDDRCRFDATVLETVVQNLVEKKLGDKNAKMEDPGQTEGPTFCPTYVVATSAVNSTGPAVLFRSYRSQEHDANECPIWKAARCTSAAPSFFRPMFVDIPAPGGYYLDGGLRYNNPSELALGEAGKIWTTVKRLCVVSIGTGQQKNVDFMDIKELDAPVGKDKAISRVSWACVLSNIPGARVMRKLKNAPSGLVELKKIAERCVEMSTSSDPVHEKMVELANSQDPDVRPRYHRFNVETGMDGIGLHEWRADKRMGQLTTQYMATKEERLKRDACVRDLMKPSDVECE